jgi:hypothetical protein
MKTISLEKAKHNAKAQSLYKENKDAFLYIILCNRTENFYLDTSSLIRVWEELVGYYINGVYTSEKLPQSMHVIDLYGCSIEVTNLKEAIEQARQYKTYSHEDKKNSDFDKRQKTYWTDIYEKLMELNQLLNEHKK